MDTMAHRIEINLAAQTLSTLLNNKVLKTYSISSALNGSGQCKGSEQTPLGLHYIRAHIGQGKPLDTVYVGRRATGEIYSQALAEQYPKRDWILTRILWLCGTQLGHNRLSNVDSMARYIYIHGTPDSEPMGVPKSHGCIRMRNQDIEALFNWAPKLCPVLIAEN